MTSTALALMLAAVAFELFGTTALKLTDGGSRPGWYAGVAVGYVVAFILFSHVLKVIPLGMAYAMWAGLGIVGTAVIGTVLFRQQLSWTGIGGMALILGGIFITNLAAAGDHK